MTPLSVWHEGDPAEAPTGADLLAELLNRPAWHADAACRGEGPGRWFPEHGQRPDEGRVICSGCPVRRDCLIAALSVAPADDDGMWAGTSRRARQGARQAHPGDLDTQLAALDDEAARAA